MTWQAVKSIPQFPSFNGECSIDAGTRQAESLQIIASALQVQADAMTRTAAAAERNATASERVAATLDTILHMMRERNSLAVEEVILGPWNNSQC